MILKLIFGSKINFFGYSKLRNYKCVNLIYIDHQNQEIEDTICSVVFIPGELIRLKNPCRLLVRLKCLHYVIYHCIIIGAIESFIVHVAH